MHEWFPQDAQVSKYADLIHEHCWWCQLGRCNSTIDGHLNSAWGKGMLGCGCFGGGNSLTGHRTEGIHEDMKTTIRSDAFCNVREGLLQVRVIKHTSGISATMCLKHVETQRLSIHSNCRHIL